MRVMNAPLMAALRCFPWVTQREIAEGVTQRDDMEEGVGLVRVGSWSLAAVR